MNYKGDDSVKIIIKDFTTTALSEDAGILLRQHISDFLDKDQIIELDFEGISLFSTTFFNASIGFFVLQMGPDKCKRLFKLVNISDLGQDTYDHSLENAEIVFKRDFSIDDMGSVTRRNIEGD